MSPEDAARDRKCRRVVAHMLTHLQKELRKPENAVLWTDAARGAGVRVLSAESQLQVLTMFEGLAIGVSITGGNAI